jgi:hypothetical protein
MSVEILKSFTLACAVLINYGDFPIGLVLTDFYNQGVELQTTFGLNK